MIVKNIPIFLIFVLLSSNTTLLAKENSEVVEARRTEHAKDVQRLNKRLNIERQAYEMEKNGNYDRAILLFNDAIKIAGDSPAASPAHLALLRIYEKMGRYNEALEEVEWFLKSNQNEQGRAISLRDKSRILKKIEESKNQNMTDKGKVSGDEQKDSFLTKQLVAMNALSDEGVEGIYKKALTLESSGKYKEALDVYFSLLPKKDKVKDAQGLAAWVMLYPAVQRTSELTGNVEKEKLALSWIKLYLFQPSDYSYFSRYLAPPTIDHIKSRMKHYKFD